MIFSGHCWKLKVPQQTRRVCCEAETLAAFSDEGVRGGWWVPSRGGPGVAWGGAKGRLLGWFFVFFLGDKMRRNTCFGVFYSVFWGTYENKQPSFVW